MESIQHLPELRARIAAWRAAGDSIAFVPTMGNLHEGHLALVRAARERAARTVVSIFVNPLQFGAGEDLDAYPRTLDADDRLLAAAGCDLRFAPQATAVYPRGQQAQTRVEVPGLSDILCGAARPGHFAGVATVVCKLFNMVMPDLALFGEKDFQQLLIVRRMAEDLAMPVEVLGLPTVREPDGLAMSSRNGYLTPAERALAPALHRILREAAAALRSGGAAAEVEAAALERLGAAGLQPEYVSVREAADLQPADARRPPSELVILAAARLGRTRLIDNLRVPLGDWGVAIQGGLDTNAKV